VADLHTPFFALPNTRSRPAPRPRRHCSPGSTIGNFSRRADACLAFFLRPGSASPWPVGGSAADRRRSAQGSGTSAPRPIMMLPVSRRRFNLKPADAHETARLDADFDLDGVRPTMPFYNPREFPHSRCIWSGRRSQRVNVAGQTFSFAAGESNPYRELLQVSISRRVPCHGHAAPAFVPESGLAPTDERRFQRPILLSRFSEHRQALGL